MLRRITAAFAPELDLCASVLVSLTQVLLPTQRPVAAAAIELCGPVPHDTSEVLRREGNAHADDGSPLSLVVPTPPAKERRRYAGDDGELIDITRDDRACADDSALPDGDTRKDDGVHADICPR